MPESTPITSISRRKFAVGAAVAATAVLLPEGQVRAESSGLAQSQSDAAAKLSPGARAEVDSKVKEIFRRYGSRLSDEQKADVRKVMADTQDGLEKMRAFALSNDDQPALVFEIYHAGERK